MPMILFSILIVGCGSSTCPVNLVLEKHSIGLGTGLVILMLLKPNFFEVYNIINKYF